MNNYVLSIAYYDVGVDEAVEAPESSIGACPEPAEGSAGVVVAVPESSEEGSETVTGVLVDVSPVVSSEVGVEVAVDGSGVGSGAGGGVELAPPALRSICLNWALVTHTSSAHTLPLI